MNRPRADTPRLTAWAGMLVAAAYLETVGGTYPAIASVTGQIVTQFLGYLLIGGWLVVAVLRPSWRPTTPLLAPIALVSAAYALSALVSQRPRLSLEPTLAGLGFALAYLLLSRVLADPWFRRRVESLVIVAVALVAFGYILEVVLEWTAWWGLIGRIAVPPLRPSFAGLIFGSPNLVAAFLILLAPLSIVVIAIRTGRRSLAIFVGAASLVAAFLTGSRGGYVGVMSAVGIGAVLAARRANLAGLPSIVADKIRAHPLLLVPVGLALTGLFILVPAVLYRFAQGGESLRIDLWRSALTIFANHPLLGAGPGTWVQLKVAANPAGVANIIVPHAHDIYVQAAAEVGLVGLAALMFLLVCVGRRLSHGLRSSVAGMPIQAAAVALGLFGFAGQSLVDNLVNLPLICLLVITLVAWIDGGLATTEPTVSGIPSGIPGGMVPAIALAALLLAAPTLGRIDMAALDDVAANDAAIAGDWPAALVGYERALGRDPDFTLYQLQRSSALARIGRTDDARNQLAAAVESDPVAINLVSLATLDLAAGDKPAATVHVRRAIDLGAFDPTIALNAGIIGEKTGDLPLAIDQFANAVAWDPPIAASSFWEAPARMVAKSDVIAAARTRGRTDPATAALVLAYAGDPREAIVELQAIPTSTAPESRRRDVYVAAALWLAGDVRSSEAKLTAMLDADPSNWLAAGLQSRIARQLGELDRANRFALWTLIVQADPSVIEEASVISGDAGDATAGLPANYPWSVYLRPISPYLFAPQVIRIGSR